MKKRAPVATGPSIVEDADLQSFGGYLRCEECGRHEPLGDVGEKFTNGWPKCCGYTMRWWTKRQIDAGEVPRL